MQFTKEEQKFMDKMYDKREKEYIDNLDHYLDDFLKELEEDKNDYKQ